MKITKEFCRLIYPIYTHITMKHIKTSLLAAFCTVSLSITGQQSFLKSLVPDEPSKAPDYLCTWNLQGYVVSYQGSDLTREAMNEEYIFGKGTYQNWVDCYPSIRKDLYFVMDDSWDIPKDVNHTPNKYLGTVELDPGRFPSFHGDAVSRLKQLTDRIKEKGWKGAGGWICAQKAEIFPNIPEEEYWTERIKAANEAGFDYWKVDWGAHEKDGAWRKMLTTIGKQYAPRLCIEHAFQNSFIEFSDAFRTYDVENVIAQPVTIQRICDLLPYKAQGNAKGIINCEDEPYIAAGLGCAIGVMRHPFVGNLPNGTQDFVFPPAIRDMKHRLDEVVRGVRWHRIAEPFGVGKESMAIDNEKLNDYWVLQDRETWNTSRPIGTKLTAEAPARVSRGMPLPEVSDSGEDRPFILASRYPNGAVAIASIGRALGHEYVSKKVSVKIAVENYDSPIGIFGYFKDITIVFPSSVKLKKHKIYAQDLAGDIPVNITKKVSVKGNFLTIPGEVIRTVGLMNVSKEDCSDPGLVLKIF